MKGFCEVVLALAILAVGFALVAPQTTAAVPGALAAVAQGDLAALDPAAWDQPQIADHCVGQRLRAVGAWAGARIRHVGDNIQTRRERRQERRARWFARQT